MGTDCRLVGVKRQRVHSCQQRQQSERTDKQTKHHDLFPRDLIR
jgi:hypothetical protein